MPKPTKPTSRLGSDPFSWIRDTRQDEPAADAPEAATALTEAAPEAAKPPEAEVTSGALAPSEEAVSVAGEVPPVNAENTEAESALETLPDLGGESAPALTLDPHQLAQLASLLQQGSPIPPPRRGRPRTNFREVTKASQEGLPENWTRATFIVREELLENLKDYAYTQRLTIRDVVDQALAQYLRGKQVLRRKR